MRFSLEGSYFIIKNFEHRKIFNNQTTTQKATAVKIAELLGCDPMSISKELKRNRFVSKEAARNIKDPICKKTLRYPNNLKNLLTLCHYL